MTNYDPQFFAAKRGGSARSAQRVLPVLFELVGPVGSLIDVGCGIGTWAATARSLGVEDVLGVDGGYIDRSQLVIPADRFVARDLSQPLELERTFDVAISLEVAEHLPRSGATAFVRDLTRLAPAILFSAAVPGQGGTDHVNEQWQDTWVRAFADLGYDVFDVIRLAVWDDPEVRPWYAQNAFVFVDRTSLDLHQRLTDAAPASGMPLRLVHPGVLELKVAAERRARHERSPVARLWRRAATLRAR